MYAIRSYYVISPSPVPGYRGYRRTAYGRFFCLKHFIAGAQHPAPLRLWAPTRRNRQSISSAFHLTRCFRSFSRYHPLYNERENTVIQRRTEQEWRRICHYGSPSASSWSWCVITTYSIHYTKLYDFCSSHVEWKTSSYCKGDRSGYLSLDRWYNCYTYWFSNL